MRGTSRLVVTAAGLVVALSVTAMPTAQASTQIVRSQPNEDLGVISSSGADTNRDGDGDFNTATKSDNGGLHYSVFNLADFGQTVHVRVELDGPGTIRDAVLVDEDVALGPCPPGGPCTESAQANFDFRVQTKDWPAGTYALSVTGTGSETATAVSTFTVHYD
jgi:hypothetical protein